MDILYNEVFKVSFFQNKNEIMMNFYEDEEKIDFENEEVYIEENINTEILFLSNDIEAKLYMDGLETLPELKVKEDEYGEVYLEPSSENVSLFSKDYYPLIPGLYRIKVVVNKKSYYSLIKVKPKLISEEECDLIKSDLEKEMKGLAFQLIRKNLAVGNNFDLDVQPIELYKFFIIKKNFSNIMASIMDLRIRPNHKICKEYKIVQNEKVKQIDEITMRNYLSNRIKENFLKVPIKELNYNLPENQWVKKIVQEITNVLEQFIYSSKNFIIKEKMVISECENYKHQESTKLKIKQHEKVINYMNELIDLAVQMKSSINILKTSEWYKLVDVNRNNFLPHVLFSDSRYNCLYKLYKELQNNEFKIEIDSHYTFQWKRTDKLYEMWCYIKICKILCNNNLGFNIIGGWLFDEYNHGERILIPELSSGTTIIFEKNDIRLHLIYDKEVPFSSTETLKNENPLYMTSVNNRPDCRLDVYKNDIYIRSIVFEIKYRHKHYIWDKRLIRNNKSAVMRQVISYAKNFESIYLFGGEKYRRFNPIYKVFILHPKNLNEKNLEEEVVDHNLKFLVMRPQKGIINVEENIKCTILELCREAEDYI
ncbi:DUF2357 domain-containing protein [Clostridium perfringens]|uniref:DUF2357 domain-containing protein n=6 Tax=Clostridium perfringens TaxID=1502 RepID=A0AAP6WL03_CLOPF|nr:DUF2357 domain-containing protein [Clostridium perfringens]EDT24383.1 conserved hypothetical protein [Clostridium perfringens B str. ATCC 3626]EHR0218614.1 DUF2357 domain-containing protein [Clostridium perfringens]EJT6158646.1 DUF2357 domain-containing protein [Clostridium perfringens]ELC8455850.1 DUF2357 domain-containing protein [Clostridium perfringens]ELC8465041.1 DUF2357 domain-containing protein [Clostridium perfringens]